MKKYTYKSMYQKLGYVVLIAGVVGLYSIDVFFCIRVSPLPLPGYFAMFSFPTILLVALIVIYLDDRPLEIDESGISNYLLGKKWKLIDWNKVKKIEKVRLYNSLFNIYYWKFIIISDCEKIKFTSWIHGLRDILDSVNLYIEKYQIPVYAIDYGKDTLRKLSVNPDIDAATRRKIAWKGYRVKVTRL